MHIIVFNFNEIPFFKKFILLNNLKWNWKFQFNFTAAMWYLYELMVYKNNKLNHYPSP